jgi:hypothetical protein
MRKKGDNRTSLYFESLIYTLLRDAFAGEITGVVYKGMRPLNSDKEDITVNFLAGHHAQKQRSTVIVNIYVPDIKVGVDNYKNHIRLDDLTETAICTLDGYFLDNVKLRTEDQRVFAVEGAAQHFSSIKIYIENFNF